MRQLKYLRKKGERAIGRNDPVCTTVPTGRVVGCTIWTVDRILSAQVQQLDQTQLRLQSQMIQNCLANVPWCTDCQPIWIVSVSLINFTSLYVIILLRCVFGIGCILKWFIWKPQEVGVFSECAFVANVHRVHTACSNLSEVLAWICAHPI